MKTHYFALLTLIVSALTSSSSGSSCGGLLESDGGEFTLPRSERPQAGNLCVWIVKLMSRQSVRFSLQELGNGLTVSLYREHDPLDISLQPIRLNNTQVGRTVDTDGQTLVVVLSSSSNSNSEDGFSFKWDSLSAASPQLISAASYVDNEAGEVTWNRFSNRERLTLSLNANKDNSLNIDTTGKIRECDLWNDCACSYVGLFELRNDGYLREVSVVCGRPSRVQVEHLYPNVLAFVYLNSSYSVGSADSVQVKWELSNIQPPRTTTDSYEPPQTTEGFDISTPQSVTECGGIVSVGMYSAVTIGYSPEGGYRNNQFCVWTLLRNNTNATHYNVFITIHGMERNYDGITLYFWNETGVVQSRKIMESEYESYVVIEARYAALSFTSDASNTGVGFLAVIYVSGNSYLPLSNHAFPLDESRQFFSHPEDIDREFYEPNETVTLVFQPYNPALLDYWRVSIDFVDIDDDTIKVYKLGRYHEENQLVYVGSGSGLHPGGIPNLTTTSPYPRLILFSSNGNTPSNGFYFTWTKQ